MSGVGKELARQLRKFPAPVVTVIIGIFSLLLLQIHPQWFCLKSWLHFVSALIMSEGMDIFTCLRNTCFFLVFLFNQWKQHFSNLA